MVKEAELITFELVRLKFDEIDLIWEFEVILQSENKTLEKLVKT